MMARKNKNMAGKLSITEMRDLINKRAGPQCSPRFERG